MATCGRGEQDTHVAKIQSRLEVDVVHYFDFDYPRVRQSLGVAALREAYPSILLNPRGDIYGINPLALWLWGELQPDGPFQPERLLGVNAFSLRAEHVDRIPAEQNLEYYTKLSAVVKRGLVKGGASVHAVYETFIATMQANQQLAKIYEAAPLYPEKEWEYPLRITHPQNPGLILEYMVSVFRLSGNYGFLIVYLPRTTALEVTEAMNSLFVERFGEGGAAISRSADKPDSLRVSANLVDIFRPYYPSFIQDPLWYIVGENEAHRQIVGTSVLHLHFFEMFFAPIVRMFLGPIQDSTAPRALKYFDYFTAPYLREDHDLHEEYIQTMQRLMQIEGFNDLLSLSRRLTIHLSSAALQNMHTASEEPFYTCRVILPWRYDPDIRLQFKSMVRFIYSEAIIIRPDIRSYQDTLVPENDETDVALMLLPLLVERPAEVSDAPLARQYLWLLALLKVVEEGCSTGENDAAWSPQYAYQRVNQGLALRYSANDDEVKAIVTEIHATLALLDRGRKIELEKLLALLHSYMLTQPSLQALTKFLRQELDAE